MLYAHIGGESVQLQHLHGVQSNITYRVVLAPVYTATVAARKDGSRIWIDGVSGETSIEWPGSTVRVVLGVAVLVGLLALFVLDALG